MPPLPAAEMIDLLCEHGLTADVAQRVYVESGGIPSLALALCGAIGEHPSVLGAPTPLPSSIARVLRDRFLAQPEEVRATLSQAALLHHPTVRQLERGGRLAAEEHVRRAAQSGLVCRAEGAIRFTPSALRQIIAELMPADDRVALHAALAEVAGTAAERLRHLALARPGVDADLARELGVAARDSAAAGAGRSPPSSTCWRPTGRRTTSASSGSSGWPRPSRPPRRATTSSWSCARSATSWRRRRLLPSRCGCGWPSRSWRGTAWPRSTR